MRSRRKKTILRVRYGVLLILCACFFSCTHEVFYNQYQAIDDISWHKDKEYYFTFQIDDISIPYNLIFEVRNNNLYPYQNLWLFYSEAPPVGPVVRDTMECVLADEYGKWRGNGISLYHSDFPIKTNHLFPHTGQYTYSFRQGMRKDSLRGIQEIGLRIEKADSVD